MGEVPDKGIYTTMQTYMTFLLTFVERGIVD